MTVSLKTLIQKSNTDEDLCNMVNCSDVDVAHFNLWHICCSLCPQGLFKMVCHLRRKHYVEYKWVWNTADRRWQENEFMTVLMQGNIFIYSERCQHWKMTSFLLHLKTDWTLLFHQNLCWCCVIVLVVPVSNNLQCCIVSTSLSEWSKNIRLMFRFHFLLLLLTCLWSEDRVGVTQRFKISHDVS